MTRVEHSAPPSPVFLPAMPAARTGPKIREIETRRISKWERMLTAERRDSGGNVTVWGITPGKERKFRARVFKGIPDRWRGAAWEVLVGKWVSNRQQQQRPMEALELERMLDRLKSDYRAGLDQPSTYDVQIDLDVPRTINGHVLFKTRYGHGYVSSSTNLEYQTDENGAKSTCSFPYPPFFLPCLRGMWVLPRHGPSRCYTALLLRARESLLDARAFPRRVPDA